MSEANARSLTIKRIYFRALEEALSIAVPAAQSLGYDTGIFWMRGSIFAATPYALVGLVNSGLSPDTKSNCFAISQIAAKQLLAELQMPRSRFLVRINLIEVGKDIIFTFDYDFRLKMNVPSLLSHYLNWWRPRITPSECYTFLSENQPYYSNELNVAELRDYLKSREDCGFITIDQFHPKDESPIPISRLLLLSLIKAIEDDEDIFHIDYYRDQGCFVFRVGNAIAIVSTIE